MNMNFIEVDLITVDIKPCYNHIYIENLIKIKLRKPFKLGKESLNKFTRFTVRKVENATHIYEILPNLNKIKVKSKSSSQKFETEEICTFFATSTCKFSFSKVLKINEQLFGLDKIEKNVIKCLEQDKNFAICLHGPSGNGKEMLTKKLDDIYEDKHFFYLDEFRMQEYKNELDDVLHSINNISSEKKNSVVFVINEIDEFDEDNCDMIGFCLNLQNLLNDEDIDIKIIMIATDVKSINKNIQKLILEKIAVPNLNKNDRMCLVKHLINELIGREVFEDGFEELIESLNGFSAHEITKFIRAASIKFPELRLEQLNKYVKMEDIVPISIQNHIKDIEPLYWSDIGGYENVKVELRRNFQMPLKHGLSIPKGILLHGPPGCSKTMFARALATECQLKLISMTPSSVMRGIVGESEAALKSMISKALELTPSIIFIDEIDTLIPKRTSKIKSSVGENLLNELMTFLDGVETKKNQKVILMGATNRLDCVDKALIRPGRVNVLIKVGLPDEEARKSILIIVFSDENYKVEKYVIERIPVIAKLLENKSGAEIVDIGRRIKKLSERQHVLDSIPTITVDHISEILPEFDCLIDRMNSLSL